MAFPVGISHVAEKNVNSYTLWKWDSQQLKWTNDDYGSTVNIGYTYDLKAGNQFQVAEFRNPSNQFIAKVNIWSGSGWRTEEFNGETNELPVGGDRAAVLETVCGQKSFVRACAFTYWNYDKPTYILIFRRKFQDSFTNVPYCYVVSKKKIKNGVDQNDLVTEYTYETSTSNYNATAGIGMFRKVSVKNPATTPVDNYFENQNYRLMGTLQKTESSVSKQETEYEEYRNTQWPDNLYQRRPVRVVSTVNGVRTEKILSYNNANGMVNRTVDQNSDGKQRISEATFAFEKSEYASMVEQNMLTQPYGSKILYKVNTAASPVVISSSVMLWHNFGTGSPWRTNRSYAWKVPMNANGVPVNDPQYQYADYIPGGTNNWVPSSGMPTEYDAYGRVIESIDLKGVVYNITIIGNNGNQVVASIANARHDECAVFTCEYC